MAEFGFVFNDLDFSDMVLRIEIVSGKDFVWLKSLAKRSQIPHILAAVYDLESRTRSVRVITLNISSRILAAESLYFNRLLRNVTKNPDKKEATLKINASEEAALMDLLNFMYINNLSATTPSDLEGVRMMAEKLEVTSCIKYVKKLSMSLQHELYYGEPSCASMAEEVKPLKDAAKKYLIERHRDLTKSGEEAKCLPFSALEIVLSSPGLVVSSENSIYYLIRGCGRHHKCFPKRLFRFINFSYLTDCPIDMDENYVLYSLLGEMSINNGFPYGGRPLQIERVYKYHPVKVLHPSQSHPSKYPLPCSVVYFNMTKQDLENLFHSKRRLSQVFYLGNFGSLKIYLVARCNSSNHFGLFVHCLKSTFPYKIGYEFAVLMKTTSLEEEYKIMFKANNCTFTKIEDKLQVGEPNLFGIPWEDFTADNSEYLVDGILNLRVEITCNI